MQSLTAFLVVCLAASAAHAKSDYPDEYALRPVQLPAGMAQAKLPVVVELSRGHAGRQVYVPFDLRLGATDELELRLFSPAYGLCLRGCDRYYNDLGLGMLYALFDERNVQVSLLGAFEVRSFASPAWFVLDVGFAFAYIHAPFSIYASPYLGIPLNQRSDHSDWVNVPIEFAYQLSVPTAVFFETGLYGDAHDPNGWSGPVGVGINQLLQHGIDIGAEFKLNTIIGHTDAGSRLALVYLMVRN